MAEAKNHNLVKKILLAAATVLMIVFFFLTPFEGLSDAGMKYLGIFIWWIVLMATALVPNHIACFAALLVAILVGVTNLSGAFTSYSSSTCMLLIGAFGMATALGNSGILNRIALLVMKLFPGTYTGQLWAVSVASIILAPTIPSASAKSSILMPIVGTIADEMGYAPHSKGAVGLLSCCNTLTQFVGLMFMTGGVGCMLMLSLSAVSITWMGWLKFALVWGVDMFLLTVLFHQFYYNPNRGSKEPAKVLDKKVIQDRIDALGKMNRQEIIALVVLVCAIALWITESYHGIPTAAVALGAWVILSCAGLFSAADFSMKIAWSVWAMVGGILGVVGLLSSTGVASWFGTLVAPLVNAISSPFLLIMVVTILHVLMVFGLVTYAVTGTIFISLLSTTSISPLCIIFAACQGSSTFVLPFQQVGVIGSLAVAGGRVEHKDIVPAAWAFVISNLIATALSVPWWKILGFM